MQSLRRHQETRREHLYKQMCTLVRLSQMGWVRIPALSLIKGVALGLGFPRRKVGVKIMNLAGSEKA